MEPLLGQETAGFPQLRRILGTPFVRNTMDWGAMIVFYSLEGTCSFWIVTMCAFGFSIFAVIVTHVRSKIEPAGRVESPKVLDLGFAGIFLCLTVSSIVSKACSNFIELWAESLMDMSIAVVVFLGV